MGKRVIIVDFNHMVHTYANSGHRLSCNINGDVVDTTIQSGTIKAIHKWSNGGCNPTAVCFDSSVPVRKAYFANVLGMEVGTKKEYKGGRAGLTNENYEAMEMVKGLLLASGVTCFKGLNYEADDLIAACVEKAKVDYPDLPIDIITNDTDILPLVDDQVSVFLRSMKSTWAESEDILKPHYIQVTPRNMEEVCSTMTAFKGFKIPYNAVLLHKLLRGDSTDNLSIESVKEVSKLFPPKKFNAMIERMQEAGVDFDKVFRYGKAVEVTVKRGTGEVIAEHKLGRYSEDEVEKILMDPNELGNITGILSCYYDFGDKITEDEREELIKSVNTHIEIMYRGMNLNGCIQAGDVLRRPTGVTQIKTFNEVDLQRKVDKIGVNLKLGMH